MGRRARCQMMDSCTLQRTAPIPTHWVTLTHHPDLALLTTPFLKVLLPWKLQIDSMHLTEGISHTDSGLTLLSKVICAPLHEPSVDEETSSGGEEGRCSGHLARRGRPEI